MTWTVGRKLLWSIGVPALLVALGGLGFYWRRTNEMVATSTREEADAVAELVAQSFTVTDRQRAGRPPAASPQDGTHHAVTAVLRSDWQIFQNVKSLRVLDRQGVVAWSRAPQEEGTALAGAEQILAQSTRVEAWHDGAAQVVRPLGGMACAGCHPAQAMKVGVLQLEINQPKLQAEVAGVFQNALWSLLAFAAVIGAATALSLHFFLANPLRRLAGVMHRAEKGDFLVRAPVDGRDEFSRLGKAFNAMLARLTNLMAQEIDTHRDLQVAQQQLTLQAALEQTNVKLEHRVVALTLLYEMARSFTSTLELPELLRRITELVASRLQIPQFSIMLVQPDGSLQVKAAYPTGHGTEGMSFATGEGACGVAAQTRRPVYIADLSRPGGVYVRHHPDERGSLLAVPMVHTDQVMGVLNFQRPDGVFSEDEAELLSAVAGQAALAVKNALLHEETVALSLTDALTGAPNRRAMFSRLEMELDRANRFGTQVSLVMIDIDHFKLLNDANGHRAGDLVLKEVYELMARIIRRVDTLARYGGEEFLLILTQVPKQDAVEIAEKLRRTIAEAPLPFGKTQPTGRITISLGVANLPTDATELERLVDCSDSALYASKRGGRDKVTAYAPGMEQHPGRERGPHAAKVRSGVVPALTPAGTAQVLRRDKP